MQKFTVTIQFVIEAQDRHIAGTYAQDLCQKRLRDLATVAAASINPISNPDEWVVITAEIKKVRKLK